MNAPVTLINLLHHFYTREVLPVDADAYFDARANLVQFGYLIEVVGGFEATAKGKALVSMLKDTPMPEVRYTDPRTGEVIK